MRKRLAVMIALSTLLGALNLALAASVAAAGGVTTTATQVYEFQPAAHRLQVTIDLTIKNTIPSTTTYESCIKYQWDYWYGWLPYASTCPQTTSYYVTDGAVWIEDGARNLKFKADSGSVSRSVSTHSYGFTSYALKFGRLFSGHSRKIHVTYDLPSSAPRTTGGIRAGEAYASFCVSGNGADGGQIRVVTPKGFDFTHSESAGLTFTTSHAGATTVYASGRLAEPFSASACFQGTNLNGYSRTSVQGPDGRSVIVAAWPEDKLWASAVANDVSTSLPELEQLVGRPLPGAGPVEIREVADLGDYAGLYSAETNVALVSEEFRQPGLVAHELSHAWFNHQNLASTWMSEGYAEWVESQSGGEPCNHQPTYPTTGKPDLADWTYLGPKATDTERAVVDYQYEAACWLIGSVADQIGEARMTTVLAALFDGTSAYGAAARNATPATWQAWLDAVDELGRVPAGELDLDLVQRELIELGAASDSAQLKQRSDSRAAYHALLAGVGDWSVPEAVTAPLTTWAFDSADRAITVAQTARTSLERADAILPEIAATSGPIQQRWEAARTQTDLDAVAALATDEAAGAEAIAGSRNLVANADPITNLGLLGSDPTALLERGVEALRAGTPATALSSASDATAMVQGAAGTGWLRLGAMTAAVLGMLFLAFFVVRRRRKPEALPAAVPAWDPLGGTASGAPSPTLALPQLASAEAPQMTLDQARESMTRLAMLVSDPESARAVVRSTGTVLKAIDAAAKDAAPIPAEGHAGLGPRPL